MKTFFGLVICGFAAMFVLAGGPARADDSAAAFKDVPPSDPAYLAVKRLHDAGLLQGYPGGYFDGKRDLTRYEMAIIVDRVVGELEREMSNPSSAAQITQKELDDARLLLSEYGTEIGDLKKHQALLDQTADRTQIHLYYYLRAPGTYQETVSAFGPTGQPLAKNLLISDGVSSYVTGTNARGTGVQVLRLSFTGNIDKQTSYGIRLENKNYFGQANVNGFDNLNPSINTYNDQGVLRINYAFLRYQLSHSPVYVVGGKFRMAENQTDPSRPSLAYENDYYNGVMSGFTGRVNGFIGFGEQGGPDLGSTVPFGYVPTGLASTGAVPHTQFAVNAHLEDQLTNHWMVGASVIDLQALPQKIWSAAKNNFVSFNQPLAAGAVTLSYSPTATQTFNIEGLQRFGNDPTTKQTWSDRGAVWAQYYLGNMKAAANNNFLELGYVRTGYNSVINQNTGLNGTPFYTGYYTGQANDRHMVYAGVHHYINSSVRIGVNYLTWGLNSPEPLVPSGTTIPAGSYMTVNDNHAVFLNTLVSF